MLFFLAHDEIFSTTFYKRRKPTGKNLVRKKHRWFQNQHIPVHALFDRVTPCGMATAPICIRTETGAPGGGAVGIGLLAVAVTPLPSTVGGRPSLRQVLVVLLVTPVLRRGRTLHLGVVLAINHNKFADVSQRSHTDHIWYGHETLS